LRKEKSRDSLDRTRKALSTCRRKSHVDAAAISTDRKMKSSDRITHIVPGDTVYLKEQNLEATVLKVDIINGEIECIRRRGLNWLEGG